MTELAAGPPQAQGNGSPPVLDDEQRAAAYQSAGLVVPAIPGRLGDAYDVQKPVGKGGYAIVYKAIRREDGRVVAVKKVEVGRVCHAKNCVHLKQ
jgi:NIMA (never in mitosis gene a)-related kinase